MEVRVIREFSPMALQDEINRLLDEIGQRYNIQIFTINYATVLDNDGAMEYSALLAYTITRRG